MSQRLIITYAILLVSAVGCSGNHEPQLVQVTGTVLLNGEPVQEADVTFMPQKGRPATGKTDKSGRFSLSSLKNQDGAIVGTYNVMIAKFPTTMVKFDPETRKETLTEKVPEGKLIPQKYANPKSSGLTAAVTADGKNDFKFELVGN